jgi:phosphatidylglycerol:prolipoprotein diacylglycerol transferase
MMQMLPYFEQPSWQVGPFRIHAFGVAVALALWLGAQWAQRRFERRALDPGIGQQLGGWIIVSGFVGAHLFAVLFYFPEKLREDPWLLVRVWEDISSFGGILGALAGGLVFLSFRLRDASWSTRLAYLDVLAFVFPLALAVGRMGCTLAHDHPGRVTSFPLAFSLESAAARGHVRAAYDTEGLVWPADAGTMGFHDLGLYEMLVLALLITPLFRYWDRRARPSGFYLFAFAALYFPVRFALDFLRVGDARYAGLTPAQWAGLVIVLLLPLLVVAGRRRVPPDRVR